MVGFVLRFIFTKPQVKTTTKRGNEVYSETGKSKHCSLDKLIANRCHGTRSTDYICVIQPARNAGFDFVIVQIAVFRCFRHVEILVVYIR